jgi:hypothetical protein
MYYLAFACLFDSPQPNVPHKLNHLLDLKQKQANIDAAESASQEAKSSARQNKTILVFTIVTIIFVSDFSCTRPSLSTP